MKSIYPRAIPEVMLYAADSLGVNLPQLARVDAKINRLIDTGEHKFIGLRVLRKGQLIFDGQYGTTGLGDDEIPLPHDAIYPLLSVTKVFTAACIMILQEWGEVNLYDCVYEWFPEYTDKPGVQLWHLLCHSSGMDEEKTNAWIEEWIKAETGCELPSWNEDGKERSNLILSVRKKLGMPDIATVDDVWMTLTLRAPLS